MATSANSKPSKRSKHILTQSSNGRIHISVPAAVHSAVESGGEEDQEEVEGQLMVMRCGIQSQNCVVIFTKRRRRTLQSLRGGLVLSIEASV